MFNRAEDHSVSFTVGDNHTSIQQSEEDGDHFTIMNNDAEDEDGEYTVGYINMQVHYEGNMADDDYVLTVEMNGGDAAFWTVEVWDGDGTPTNTPSDELCVNAEEFTDSNETQAYNNVYDFGEIFVDANSNGVWDDANTNCWSISRAYEMGLNVTETDDIRLRVTPANESVAESYADGHSMLVKVKNMPDGSFSEYELKLFIPQTHGAELASEIVDVIGIQPGNDETYTFVFENTGNGDDTYSISISDLPEALATPPLWSVTGPSSLTVGPRTTQAYSVSIHVSELWVDDVEPFPVTVTIQSEDNTTDPLVVTLNLKTALPILEIVDVDDKSMGILGLSQGGFAPMGQTNQFYLEVYNDGDVDARDVQVEILDDNDVIVGSATLDVPMKQNTMFTIDIAAVDKIGSIDYTVRINTTGLELGNPQPVEEMKSIQYQPEVSTEANNWLGLVVALIIAGLIGLFWKFSGRRGSQAF
ncbi:MAG: Uncharacterised protein [Marine Group II euryarchaeote MED-G33]|nr:MAG: Uncharacterised protein [Marine Group II euryarchaeote MED-G33]